MFFFLCRDLFHVYIFRFRLLFMVFFFYTTGGKVTTGMSDNCNTAKAGRNKYEQQTGKQ